MRTKEKNTSRFPVFYLIYVLVLAAALAALFFYVRDVMVEYENNTADKYVLSMLSNSSSTKNDLSEFLDRECFGKDTLGNPESRKKHFNEFICGELKVDSSKTNLETGVTNFEISSDGKPFMTIGLKEGHSYTKLGILTMSDWELSYAVLRNENSKSASLPLNQKGRYACKISYTEGFTLLIDGEEYTPGSDAVLSEHPDFVYVSPFVKAPALISVSLEFSYEPDFSAKNNAGTVVAAEKAVNNSFVIPAEFEESKEAEEVISKLNPLDKAMLWSKFMTNDVGGKNYGFDTVVEDCSLLEGTNLYTLAKNWSKNVDIRFVSVHTIKGWTKEKVSNCIKYNDTLYSCDVYIEKNMHLKTGADRTDIFNNRMYFAKIDGAWYLLDMFSLAE